MTQKTSPFLNAAYGWDLGESGWNSGMDGNILDFSFMHDRNVDGIVSVLPAPSEGKVYYLTTDNTIYYVVGGVYRFLSPPKWFIFTDKVTGQSYQFDGSTYYEVPSAGSLGTRLDAAESTINSLGTAAFEDKSYFETFSENAVQALESNLLTASLTTGSALVAGARVQFESVTQMKTVSGRYDGDTADLLSYAVNTGLGGSAVYWDADATETENGWDIWQVTGVTTGRWKRLWPYSALSKVIVDATWIGLAPSVVDNGILLNNLMADPRVVGVEIPAGDFNIVTPVTLPARVTYFKGAGKNLTRFIQNAPDAPARVISTTNGAEYAYYGDFAVFLKLSTTASVTSKGFSALGVRRSQINNIFVYTDGHTVDLYSGVGIDIDMQTVANAYTNIVKGCVTLGTTVGIWSHGPITSSQFLYNHLKSFAGIRFTRGTGIAGTSPITGNQVAFNTIQAHSSSTFGLGNGIDWAYGDAYSGTVLVYSNQIYGNYVERELHGIIFREGSVNNEVGSQMWDSNTNNVTDLNPTKVGYVGIDAQTNRIRMWNSQFKSSAIGLSFAAAESSTYFPEGLHKTVTLAGSDTVTCSDARWIKLAPNGANRSGVILSTSGCVEGQVLELYIDDVTNNVTLSATNLLLNNSTGVTMGNEATGRARYLTFRLVISQGSPRWMEIGRNIKPA